MERYKNIKDRVKDGIAAAAIIATTTLGGGCSGGPSDAEIAAKSAATTVADSQELVKKMATDQARVAGQQAQALETMRAEQRALRSALTPATAEPAMVTPTVTRTMEPTVASTATGTSIPETATATPSATGTPKPSVTAVPSETPTGEQPRYTNVHAIEDGTCRDLSTGEETVWKDYLRKENDVNIHAHDGNGEQGSKVCRGETDWGWRVPWEGFGNYEAAQEYALGEADRVWEAKDANPLRPGLDPVDNVRVFDGAELVKEYR